MVQRHGDKVLIIPPQQDHAPDGSFKSSAIWQDCPGCPQCEKNGGLILRKGAWRPTSNFEYIYQLTKTDKYFSDNEAVREDYAGLGLPRAFAARGNEDRNDTGRIYEAQDMGGRNLRSVWTINTEPLTLMVCKDCYRIYERPGFSALKTLNGKKVCACGSQKWGSHYASFPTALPERCIKASTSEYGVCSKCGSPYARIVDSKPMVIDRSNHAEESGVRIMSSGTMLEANETTTLGWKATCTCEDEVIPAVILDPFVGSGSTLLAASGIGRKSIGIDLSEMYCHIARHRNSQGVLV